jgi:hypothetical protein
MMMGTNRTYVFKEGEGFVFGKYVLYSDYNAKVEADYITLAGRAWSASTEDDDSSQGMIIGAKAFNSDYDDWWYEKGSAFDFSEYKTLNFEFALTTGNSNYGIVGYCEDQRISRSWLYHNDNAFNGYDIRELYRGGAYERISGTARQTVSFDISGKTSGIIAMLSPIAYSNAHYAKIFNIWLE